MTIIGSIIVAADAKHMKTPRQIFDGHGLDFVGGEYKNHVNGGAFYQVRYTTNDFDKVKIPIAKEIDGYTQKNGWAKDFTVVDEKYPYAGTGFVPNAPELYTSGTGIQEAIIVKISPDGTEEVVAVKEKGYGRFASQ